MMTSAVIAWSSALVVVAAINMLAWALAAGSLWRRQAVLEDRVLSFRRQQLLLSAGYVFGCAYRSVLPVFDVPRVALVDSVLSSAAVGRSVATVAELCFVAQWALVMRHASVATGSRVAGFAARVILPLIVVAELCSWHSVLTTSNLGHVFEESLWSVATALIVVSLMADWDRRDRRWRRAAAWLVPAGIVYFLYLVLVDVPMYWSRWVEDESAGKTYLSLVQGLLHAAGPPVVTYDWQVWRSEMGWMAAYFSAAVWVSIWLVHAPVPGAHPVASRRRLRIPIGIPGLGVLSWRRARF